TFYGYVLGKEVIIMSKSGKRIWVSLICLLLVVTGGVVYAASSGLFSDSGKELGPEDGEEYVKAIESRKAAITGVTIPEIETSPYEKYIGDSRIQKDRQRGLESWYIKQILILENKIPSDAPYLTKEKAIELCNGLTNLPEMAESEWQNIVMASFDEIAFAPDFKGGSGKTRIVYYTDETHSKAVYIIGFSVSYIDYDLSNTESELLFTAYE
ncbi:MAG: hypothetical protein J6T47_08335, partial [Lachnospiraceae bacterium]|nr:hypothetical protein [Lachnospiraceae bacterium]